MKQLCLGVLSICFTFLNIAVGQGPLKLTMPVSPAFSILNFEPSAVMRPTSARDLAADVLNAFDKDGKLLMNLGLEITPYWMRSHPTLTRNTYLNPNVKQAFLQSFSFSVSTVKDSVLGNNNFGAGFRFKLFNGKPVGELMTASAEQSAKNTILNAINAVRLTLEEADTKQSAIEAIVKNLQDNGTSQQVVNTVKKQAEKVAANYGNSTSDIKAFLENLISIRAANEVELNQRISNLIYERRGFILEFAGATGYNGSNKNLEQIGFWGNASYAISPANLFTFTARYLHSNNDTSARNLDLGIGFLVSASSYNIALEAMFRNYKSQLPGGRVEKDITSRFAVQGSYKISETISLSFSMGKDFESPFISRSGFFSILGFNYSIFSKVPPLLSN